MWEPHMGFHGLSRKKEQLQIGMMDRHITFHKYIFSHQQLLGVILPFNWLILMLNGLLSTGANFVDLT
jgi:hypothetical protein